MISNEENFLTKDQTEKKYVKVPIGWDKRFLSLAQLISSWSKDPSTKVGAVIVDQYKRIISTGFNGFPRKIVDYPSRLSHRETKYNYIVHAEINAVLFARADLTTCTLYTYPMLPCVRCAAQIIQTGIKRVVSLRDVDERWYQSVKDAEGLFQEARVEVSTFDSVNIT